MSRPRTRHDRKADLNRQRVARRYVRRKARIGVAAVDYDGYVLDELVQLKLLAETDDKDQAAINLAISRFLAERIDDAYDLRNFLRDRGHGTPR